MTIVLDTNVLVSGIINPHGPPGRIVDLLRAGELRLAVDDRILEYLRGNSERLIATTRIAGLPDEHDAPFQELAKAAGTILVTGNLKHCPVRKRSGVTVESPAEFVQRFES